MYKLIKVDNEFYLLSDDPIEVGDGVGETLIGGVWMVMTIHTRNDFDKKHQKKIIASTRGIAGIKLLDRDEIEILITGVNIKALASVWALDNADSTMGTNSALNRGFIGGYKRALQDNADKQFTLEEMGKIIRSAYIHGQGNAKMMEAGLERDETDDHVNWVMLGLRKSTGAWNVELEMEEHDTSGRDLPYCPDYIPKVNDRGYITIKKIL
jgi:hypothetical protein